MKGYDVVILGGGSAGCVLASRLSEDSGRSVCLIEAGHDYGLYEEGRWPKDLLNAHELTDSHDWGIGSRWPFSRARVLGGCSAHNLCFIVWGLPADYDEWGEAGNAGWSHAALDPYRRRSEQALRARPSRIEDLEPFNRAGLDAAMELGLPKLEDFDDPQAAEGAAAIRVNAVGAVRWNAAFAYLDPARGRSNLRIMSDTLVDRLSVEGGRVAGVIVQRYGVEMKVAAGLVILAAGAYGSPAVLLRSGIGPAEVLEAASIQVRDDRPGVGRNLVDHPALDVWYQPSAGLLAATAAHDAADRARAQSVIRARSQRCAPDRFDLHIVMGVVPPVPDEPPFLPLLPGERLAHFFVCAMKPKSRGRVCIRSADPQALPVVDDGFRTDDGSLTDGGRHDLSILVDGVWLARRLAGTRALSRLCDGELAPGLDLGDGDLEQYACRWRGGYWHPVGTCKMGPETDSDTVVDRNGCVYGFTNLFVADASVLPTIPRANTHLPVLAVAERIAEVLRRR
jgi:choline dehydrogenase